MKDLKMTFFWVFVMLLCTLIYIAVFSQIPNAQGKPPLKSKFYDFSETLIDGEIKKPIVMYNSSRGKIKFERLFRLKKSFMPDLYMTHKEKVFK